MKKKSNAYMVGWLAGTLAMALAWYMSDRMSDLDQTVYFMLIVGGFAIINLLGRLFVNE